VEKTVEEIVVEKRCPAQKVVSFLERPEKILQLLYFQWINITKVLLPLNKNLLPIHAH